MGHHDDKRPDERVVDYIYGELTAADAARFEAEMRKDPALAAEVRELQAVASLAAEGAEPVPDLPEAAVAEAMAAAQARCDQVRGGELGFWDRIAAWLLTPQLAGALTLVLVISVGVYTLQTGVFDRNKADEPSVKHEMAPVGPVGEAEDSPAAKTDRAAEEAEASAASIEGRQRATEAQGGEAHPSEESASESRREIADIPESPPAMDWATDQQPAPNPAPRPAEAAGVDKDAGGKDRWKDGGVEQVQAPTRGRGLDTLVDLATPGDLSAAQDLDEADDVPAMEPAAARDRRAGVTEFRTNVDGDAGNFVEKSLKKPEATVAGTTSGTKNEKKRKRKVDPASSNSKKTVNRKTAPKKDQVAPATKLRSEDSAPAPVTEGKARQVDEAKRVEIPTAPKITRSLLDGIVVPPSAGPERAKQEEVPVTANASLSDQTISRMERTGADDDDLGATSGTGGAPLSGEFGDAGLDEDAEPGYMVRPDAAEAPGIMVTKSERRRDAKKSKVSKKSARTSFAAPVIPSIEEPAPTEIAQLEAEEERSEVEDKAQVEEVSKEDAPASPRSKAAACAALTRAIEDAEEAEDWALAEKLTQQMIALGCLSGADLETVQEKEVRYLQKAAETDFSATEVGEDAPAAEKAAEPADAPEKPDQMK